MRTLSILYVEDHKLLFSYVKELLEAQGWSVDACQDGLSALEKIEGGSPYDVLILDNGLPGMSGLELVQRARSLTHRRRTPIIMLSASDAARAALRAGTDVFLKKPYKVETIIETVKGLVGVRS
jgi:two-component system response regulator QseB